MRRRSSRGSLKDGGDSVGRDNRLILIRECGKGGGLFWRALFFFAACERSPKALRRLVLHACLFEWMQLCRVCMGGKW
jgi:hypothetical protein